ncbi:MAG: hypothetical protein R3E68_22235 [Burkholderiaceae bacterium]
MDRDDAAARLIRQLEYLDATRNDLRDTIERMVVTAESAPASMKRVCRSTRNCNRQGRLESSKEELQALNEELNTVNQQLQFKIAELEAAERDLQNLLASSEIATICLDSDCCLKWFSPTTTTCSDCA